MGMGIEEMVGGMLEIAFKAFLAGIAVGKQQIPDSRRTTFKGVVLFFFSILSFLILQFYILCWGPVFFFVLLGEAEDLFPVSRLNPAVSRSPGGRLPKTMRSVFLSTHAYA